MIVYVWLISTKENFVLWLIQKKIAGLLVKIFKGYFKEFDKSLDNINRLRSKLDELEKDQFNANNEHYLNYIDERLKLVNFSKLPQKIEKKKETYNKKADDLSDLLRGCNWFVKDMIIKNSLEHLHRIDIIRDDKNQVIEWQLGSEDREAKLSELLSFVLKNRILKGDKIDKLLFDSIDSTFYNKIMQNGMDSAFKYFLINLNKEVELQRDYGCLKLFNRCYGETKELVDDLLNDVNKYKI